jgi:hypothetical protein
LFLLGATSTALPIRTSNFTQAVSSKWFARVRIGKAVESGAVGGQAIAAGERSWSVLFLIKSKFHWSNFKEIYFAQNVTVTQKDKSTIFFSSVHCVALVCSTFSWRRDQTIFFSFSRPRN